MRCSTRRLIDAGALGALAALLLAGCALTSKGEPLTPRYFTPLSAASAPSAPSAPSQARAADEASPALRLGRVAPAAHLEERIAYRVSDTELAYYDDRRWTEPPDELVRRALEQELFERRGLERVISGAAPTLEVDVVGFEELREPPLARVSLRVTLHDERRARLERTFTVDAPLGAGEDPGPALARAMAGALSSATRQVAESTLAALEAERDSVARR